MALHGWDGTGRSTRRRVAAGLAPVPRTRRSRAVRRATSGPRTMSAKPGWEPRSSRSRLTARNQVRRRLSVPRRGLWRSRNEVTKLYGPSLITRWPRSRWMRTADEEETVWPIARQWHPRRCEQQQSHGAKPRRYVVRPMQPATVQPGHAEMHEEQQSDQPVAWWQRLSAWTSAFPHQIGVDDQQRNHALTVASTAIQHQNSTMSSRPAVPKSTTAQSTIIRSTAGTVERGMRSCVIGPISPKPLAHHSARHRHADEGRHPRLRLSPQGKTRMAQV